MHTMNISLPKPLKDFVDGQVVARGYGSPSEYIGELIRRDRDCQRLRTRILEGAASPPAVTAGADYFNRLRGGIRGAGRR